jgi:hypothetical protein
MYTSRRRQGAASAKPPERSRGSDLAAIHDGRRWRVGGINMRVAASPHFKDISDKVL